MRRLLTLLSAVSFFNGIAFAGSPVGDWQSVQDMPPGWQITVVAGHKFSCVFVRATDDELICGRLQRGWTMRDPPEIGFHRDEIREVRVDRGDDANTLAGAAIGGTTGAVFGATAAESSKGAAAFLFGAIGTAIGARIGQDVHVLRGKVIYRSEPPSKPQRKSTNTLRSPNGRYLNAQTSL